MIPIAFHQICVDPNEGGLHRAYDLSLKIAYLFCLDSETSFRAILVLLEAFENSFSCQLGSIQNGCICASIAVSQQEITVNIKDHSADSLMELHSNINSQSDLSPNQEIGIWIKNQLIHHIFINEAGNNVSISFKRGGGKSPQLRAC